MSNARRRRINVETQRKRAVGKDCEMFTIEGATVPVFHGTRLISTVTNKWFTNGQLIEYGERLKDLETGEEINAPKRSIEKGFRLAWALTVHNSRGRTLNGRVRVYDLTSKPFTPTHLYVAISRVSDPSKLECLP